MAINRGGGASLAVGHFGAAFGGARFRGELSGASQRRCGGATGPIPTPASGGRLAKRERPLCARAPKPSQPREMMGGYERADAQDARPRRPRPPRGPTPKAAAMAGRLPAGPPPARPRAERRRRSPRRWSWSWRLDAPEGGTLRPGPPGVAPGGRFPLSRGADPVRSAHKATTTSAPADPVPPPRPGSIPPGSIPTVCGPVRAGRLLVSRSGFGRPV